MFFARAKQHQMMTFIFLGNLLFGFFAFAQTPLLDPVTGRQVKFTESQSDIDRTRRLQVTGMREPQKITHCYHYIAERQQNSRYLSQKINYANENAGHFFIPPPGKNGAVAGPGVYCAKTLVSTVYYGDRVIRIELADDVVILDRRTNIKYCRQGGENFTDSRTDESCKQKRVDLKYYQEQYGWYVISTEGRPNHRVSAVKEWSADDALLIADLQQTIDLIGSGNREVLVNSSGLDQNRILTLLRGVQQRSQAAAQQNGAPQVFRPVNGN